MERQDFMTTEEGTPQGGVISPLLANIALHGMEEVAKEGFKTHGSGEKQILVRYADDFVILYSDQAELQRVAEKVTTWLAEMGLQLSQKKTRTTHTLEAWEGNVVDSWGSRCVNTVWEKPHGKRPYQRPLGLRPLSTKQRSRQTAYQEVGQTEKTEKRSAKRRSSADSIPSYGDGVTTPMGSV